MDVELGVLQRLEELVDQPGLAHARITQDVDDLSLAAARRRQRLDEQTEFAFPADESGQRPGLVPCLPTRPHLTAPAQDVNRYLVRKARDFEAPAWLHGNEALDELHGVAGQQDAAGLGHLLHAAGEVHGLPDRVVIDRQVVADRAHHDLAGIEADPDPEALAGEALDASLDRQRGVAGPERVMLLRERGAEQDHDAVALDPGDEAAGVVDRLQHDRERSVDLLVSDLRVVAEQRARADHVGEQDRDQLPPALDDVLEASISAASAAGL